MIKVAVAGAAGRMGKTVCQAVEGAQDMELTGRADPALGTAVGDVLAASEVLVDFTMPDTAVENARIATPTERDTQRIEKYHRAIKLIEAVTAQTNAANSAS